MKPRWTRAHITWTNLELGGLLEDEDSCVKLERVVKHLALVPNDLVDLQLAIRQNLDTGINCHDNEYKGLVIAYKNPKIISPAGTVLHDSCFIHIDVEVDLYVFRPEVGKSLRGFVNKIGTNHIGILVHKAFNVSIPQPDRLEQWPVVANQDEWPGHKVKAGQEVRFTIEAIDFKSRLPYMRGSLDKGDYLRGCKLFNQELAAINDSVYQGTNRHNHNSNNFDKKKNKDKVENKKILFNSDEEDDNQDNGQEKKSPNKNVKLELNSPVKESVKSPSKKRKRQSSETESPLEGPSNKKQKIGLKQKKLFDDLNNSELDNHTENDALLNGTTNDYELSSQNSEKNSSSDVEKESVSKKRKKKSSKNKFENNLEDDNKIQNTVEQVTDQPNLDDSHESNEQPLKKAKKRKSKSTDCVDTEDEKNYKSTLKKSLNHFLDDHETESQTVNNRALDTKVIDDEELLNTDDERNYKLKLKKEKLINNSISEFAEPQGIPKKRKKKVSMSETNNDTTDDERREKKALLKKLTGNKGTEEINSRDSEVPKVKSKKKKKGSTEDPNLMDTEDEREYKSSLKPLIKSIEENSQKIKLKKRKDDLDGINLKTEPDCKKAVMKALNFQE